MFADKSTAVTAALEEPTVTTEPAVTAELEVEATDTVVPELSAAAVVVNTVPPTVVYVGASVGDTVGSLLGEALGLGVGLD